MSVLLSIDSVCKNFGPFQALDNIHLDIEQGEFIVLLGPSGCGKTTLLRSIAGFMQPDSGSIAIDGQDVSRVAP
jgi:spermidine/putrescine transport system ATP-binding protein